MSAEVILGSSLWRLVAWLPGIILKRIFKADILAHLTVVEVRSRNEAARVFCGEMPNVRISVEIRNRSPFEIELDRLTALVTINSTICTITYLNRVTIRPHTDMDLNLYGDMTAPQAFQLLGLLKQEKLTGNPTHRKGALSINADFNCRIGNFRVRDRYLDGIDYQITNPQLAPITDIENRLRAIEEKVK